MNNKIVGYNAFSKRVAMSFASARKLTAFGLMFALVMSFTGLDTVFAHAFDTIPEVEIGESQNEAIRQIIPLQEQSEETFCEMEETVQLFSILERTIQQLLPQKSKEEKEEKLLSRFSSLSDLQFHLENIAFAFTPDESAGKVSSSNKNSTVNEADLLAEKCLSSPANELCQNSNNMVITMVGPQKEWEQQVVSDKELEQVLMCEVSFLPIQTIKKEYSSQTINQHVYLSSLPDYLSNEDAHRAATSKWSELDVQGDNSLSQGIQPKRSSVSITSNIHNQSIELTKYEKPVYLDIVIIALHTPKMSNGPPLLENQIFQSSPQFLAFPQEAFIQKSKIFRPDTTTGISIFQQSKSGNTSLTSSINVIQSYTKNFIRGEHHV